jgi:DNA-binding LacI/PurR family transcriptional regulator
MAPPSNGEEASVPGAEIRPKLADVAEHAGVSAATASRVLTGSARVRPETRQQVEAAIASLGYVRNRAPRASAAQPTGSIAFMVCEDNARVFSEPFFPLMLRSVSRELSARGIQLVLLTAHAPRDYQIASRYLRGGHVDGALVISMHGQSPIDLGRLGVPVVLAGRAVGPDTGISYVDADNAGGAQLAVDYLLKRGRTTVATIAGPPDMAPGAERLTGYRKAKSSAGLTDPGLVVFGDFGRATAEHAMGRLLDRRPAVDAVFAASDLMALGALHALRRAGRRVPEDVAVIGFEDSPLARHTEPKLTTVRQPVEAMGTRMATELLALISRGGEEPTQTVLPTELVIRDSA